MARTADSMSPCPVSMSTHASGSIVRISSSTAKPSCSGIDTSSSTASESWVLYRVAAARGSVVLLT